MRKRIINIIMVIVLVLMASLPAFADDAAPGAQAGSGSAGTQQVSNDNGASTPVPGDTAATPPAQSNADKNAKLIARLQTELTMWQNKLAGLQNKIKDEIAKAIARRDKQAQDNQQKETSIQNRETKIDDSLSNMKADEQQELTNIDNETKKWQDWVTSYTAKLHNNITDIDTNLQKRVDALNKQIAAAKTDDQKQKLQAAIDSLTKYAQQKKDAINEYLTDLQAFWTDKQKVYDERKALITRRQGIQDTFSTTMASIEKSEMNDQLANITAAQSTTDDQITSSVTAKFQKQMDNINARIQKIQDKINAANSAAN